MYIMIIIFKDTVVYYRWVDIIAYSTTLFFCTNNRVELTDYVGQPVSPWWRLGIHSADFSRQLPLESVVSVSTRPWL